MTRIFTNTGLESSWSRRYLESMKRVEAIIRPHRLSETVAALVKLDVKGMAISDVLGMGRQQGHSEIFEESVCFPGVDLGMVPKKMLTLFIEDAQAQPVVDAIAATARTGYYGDGRIVVSQVESIRHIHNGED